MPAKAERFAGTRILDIPYQADRDYDYIIPAEFDGCVAAGDIVVVPFGRGNRKKYAVVREVRDSSAYASPKSITALTGVSIGKPMLGLCEYMKDRFFCSFGEAARVMAPTYALPGIREYYSPSEGTVSGGGNELLSYIIKKSPVSYESIRSVFPDPRKELDRLVSLGSAEKTLRFAERRTLKRERAVLNGSYASKSPDELSGLVRGSRQREILSYLSISGEEDVRSLCEICGATRKTVETLVSAGFISIVSDDAYRDPYSHIAESASDAAGLPDLTEAQQKAADRLVRLSESAPSAALLFGVTGSGKTEVICRVVDSVLKKGKSVIILLPEISLTPQTVAVFYSRYPGITTVLHSGLSDGQRFDAWRRMSEGSSRLCIGTRSAVFSPVRDLGLIVIDEEQEHTYRSESSPRYHARDVARYRCANEKAMLLLSSATPSVGSFRKAAEGRYELVRLGERFGGAKLPELVISDMRREPGTPAIGSELRKKLSETLQKNEQAILYVGKRGYSSSLVCASCGRSPVCPRCSVSFTHHVSGGGRSYFECHWCGLKTPVPDVCPSCGKPSLRRLGLGTQLVEEKLRADFPAARILRMDSDTVKTRSSYDGLLGDFRARKADILVGTQMVTKGHNFPFVTLVGVIDADAELYRSDYASAERAFDLFTQVSGRAGRADLPGTALIQTYSPDHPVLNELTGGSYAQMFSRENEERRVRQFPPYCDLVIFTVSSANEGSALEYSEKAAAGLAEAGKTTALAIFGPMNAPMYKVNGIFRRQVVVKCGLNRATRDALDGAYLSLLGKSPSDVSVSVDVNP